MRSPALSKAIKNAGGPSKLARLLKLTPQAVSQWTDVPVKYLIAVEREGGVPRQELLPDLYKPASDPIPASARTSQQLV